jgi:hypothetical protein
LDLSGCDLSISPSSNTTANLYTGAPTGMAVLQDTSTRRLQTHQP